MSMTLKPIETRYKGYRFRSRLEARWAVFFDALGVEWEYEVEGYDLGAAGFYLPDFELYRSLFIEIKPSGVGLDDAVQKCEALKQQSGYDVLLLKGKPSEYIGIYWHDHPGTGEMQVSAAILGHCQKCPSLAIGYVYRRDAAIDSARAHNEQFDGWSILSCAKGCSGEKFRRGDRYTNAVLLATGARFEHGGTP